MVNAVERIKHVNGVEGAEREAVESRKQNATGSPGKSSEIVTFQLDLSDRKEPAMCRSGRVCSQQGQLSKPRGSEMGTRLFYWRNRKFSSTSGRAVKEVRKVRQMPQKKPRSRKARGLVQCLVTSEAWGCDLSPRPAESHPVSLHSVVFSPRRSR